MKKKERSGKQLDIVLALKQIYHHHLQFWKILGIDLALLLMIYLVSLKLNLVLSGNINMNTFFVLAYFILMFVLYTIAKYVVMLMVQKIVDNTSQNFVWAQVKEFMLVNLIAGIAFFFVMSVLGWAMFYGLKENARGIVGLIVYSIVFLFFYVFINALHSVFFLLKNKKECFVETFSLLKKKFFPLFSVFLIDLIILGIFLLCFSLVGISIKKMVLPLNPAKINDLYNFLFVLFLSFFLYVTHYINRVFIFIKARSYHAFLP